jgi:hypothetical protein
MCYWCHKIGYNKSAPPHRSENCRDNRNLYSKNYLCPNCYVCGVRTIRQQNSRHDKIFLRCPTSDYHYNIIPKVPPAK